MSTYSFGWWDFLDGEDPAMLNRFSTERIVDCGPLDEAYRTAATAAHPDRPDGPWRRFEYQHDDFWLPLAVLWHPRDGQIFVDYNISTEIWRSETNAATDVPPYGGWCRVDDIVPDALWSWPGILENIVARADQDGGILCAGGWSNGRWQVGLRSLDHTGPSLEEGEAPPLLGYGGCMVGSLTEYDPNPNERHLTQLALTELLPFQKNPLPAITNKDFRTSLQSQHQSVRELTRSVDAQAPSPWRFVVTAQDKLQLNEDLAGRAIVPDRKFSDGNLRLLQSSDGTRVMTIQGGQYQFELIYQTVELAWLISLTESPIVRWPHSDRGFFFSHFLHMEVRRKRRDWHFLELSLEQADAVRRDVFDAMMQWPGTPQDNLDWHQYRSAADSRPPERFLLPVDGMSALNTQLAGRRCVERARYVTSQ